MKNSIRLVVSVLAILTMLGGIRPAVSGQFPSLPTPQLPQVQIPNPVQVITDAGKELGKVAENVKNEVTKGAENVVKTGVKAGTDIANTAAKAGGDVVATTTKALDDTVQTGRKALDDGWQETGRAVKNLVDAGAAVVHFTEREAKSKVQLWSNAEKRAREGKFVDAVWHLATEELQYSEDNAAKATQESSLLNTTAQVAASAYGGPGGAAAYAAWSTYKRTNDAELAIRVGVITGATAAGMAGVNTLPSDQLATKAILAGAIGGTAVAAAGGSEEDVRDGFIKAAGMVIVQDGYERVTTHKLDARGSRGDAYCINTLGAECSAPDTAYERDANGNILRDKDGNPKVDIRKTDPSKPHVGLQGAKGDKSLTSEQGPVMTAVSRVPVMNAMSVFHDQWAMSWKMEGLVVQGTIVPAVVLTYIGTGDPVYSKIQNVALDKRAANMQSSNSSTPNANEVAKGSLPTSLYQEVPYSSFICTQDRRERTIMVRTISATEPLACEVLYQTEAGISTPWKGRNDAGYCFEPALKLALKLDTLGWSCVGR